MYMYFLLNRYNNTFMSILVAYVKMVTLRLFSEYV